MRRPRRGTFRRQQQIGNGKPSDGAAEKDGVRGLDRSDVLPLSALSATAHHNGDDGRLFLQSADVIIGVDKQSGEEYVVYGNEVMERSLWGGGQAVLIARVALELGVGELEHLLTIVRDIKGDHDHQPR